MRLSKDKDYDKRKVDMINKYKKQANEIDVKYHILDYKFKRNIDRSIAVNNELNAMWEKAKEEFDVYNIGHVITVNGEKYIIKQIKGNEYNAETYMLIKKYGMMPIYMANDFNGIITYLKDKYDYINKDEYVLKECK